MSAVLSENNVQTIGRYTILRAVGKGSHGDVLLGTDRDDGRKVAIKVHAGGASELTLKRLRREAEIAARLDHPNIVKLHETLEHRGRHFLIFEFVEGMTLAQLLRQDGRMEPTRAARIAARIADTLAHAHGQDVIHRDIKPANIMICAEDITRVMDFGIATFTSALQSNNALHGTPRYMAPERLRNEPAGPSTDIFALGAVLFEMLTGRPAFGGGSTAEVMHKIAHEAAPAPSTLAPETPEALDQIVLKALGKTTAERYASADEMLLALRDYIAGTEQTETGQPLSPLEMLMERMKQKGNFPALSATIGTINRVAADSDESVQTLSSALLKDFALTNKLLRLVNSSTYGQFGSNISTITRAVMILGFQAVRDLAITLILFEHLQNKAQAAQLKEDVISAYFTGIMAHRIAGRCGIPDSEEGFVCGVFHNLGPLLATYYFYEESQLITQRMRAGQSEEQASRGVLGISYEELGIGVARSWHLPEKIVSSMQRAGGGKVTKPANTGDKLKVMANFAAALCKVAAESAPERKVVELDELGKQFSAGIKIDKNLFTSVVDDSVKQFLAESTLFIPESGKSKVLQAITRWSAQDRESQDGSRPAVPADGDTISRLADDTARLAAPDPTPSGENSVAMLTAGIREISATLTGNYNLNDVLRIILETMYRGVGFTQVLLCTRDPRQNRLMARFGFGARTEELVKFFSVPLGVAQNLFQLAIEKNVDLYITDTRADNVAGRIPSWYREKIGAQAFLAMPLVINGKAIGMLYADREKSGELRIESQQMQLLKALRDQAILAIRQK